MGFIETLYNHKIAILKILVITILFIYLILHLVAIYGHSYIQKNWAYFRSKPYLTPLAGFFKKDNKEGLLTGGIKSVLQLIWTYIKLFFKELIKPVQYIINIITKIIDSIKTILDKFRQQLAVIRKLLFNIVEKVMERLQNLAAAFISLFMKLRDTMKRSFATYQMMVYTIETMGLTLKSMMSGPVGDMALLAADLGQVFTYFLLGPMSFFMFPSLWHCALCFHGNTKILLHNKSNKLCCISELTLGTKLETGYVTGIMVFYTENKTQFYNYNKDLVTGEHYVLETNWIPVKDSENSHLSVVRDNLLYCISTSNHRIKTFRAEYLDFDETSDLDILELQKNKALALLNGHDKVKISRKHLYQEGFIANTVPFGAVSKIDLPYNYLDIYDNIDNSNTDYIMGIGEWQLTADTRIYQHIASKVILTGSVIIYENNNWIPVYQSKHYSEIVLDIKYPSKIYNWVTKSGTIKVDGIIARDLLEIHDTEYHTEFTLATIKKP